MPKAVLILFLALLSCRSPVPATVTWGPATQLTEGPTVFVTANQQRPRVEQSLRDAGLTAASSASEASYWLRVDIGSSRGSEPCGSTNNVRYILSQLRTRMMVIKGRGPTGTCTPNILDDMSRLLASYFRS